jgi:uncharacterized repeat protein (TIGR03803 family)
MRGSTLRIWLRGVVVAMSALALTPAWAATVQTLYSFTGGADGQGPYGQLAIDKNGLLYGTTVSGGAGGGGTVFRFDPTTGLLTTLHAFTVFGPAGSTPAAGVVIDGAGILYGTTETGGLTADCDGGCGTVYKLDPASGQLTTLAAFTGGADGRLPAGALTLYGGLLYGTTVDGGYVPQGSSGYGVIFKLNPKTKALTTLHEFSLPGVRDGVGPVAALTVGPDGRLYGTASAGGPEGSGTVYAINPKTGAFAMLHGFDYHVDGSGLDCALTFRNGQIIGTTRVGGPTAAADGTVFSLDPKSGVVTTLYSMPGSPGGIFPDPGVVRGPGGLLYGTNNQGGSAGAGTLFTLNPTTHAFTLLHDFTGGGDGSQPSGEMLSTRSGVLYGVTAGGGRGHGVIYKVTP